MNSVGEPGHLYSEHSMRRGGATQAAHQGLQDNAILQTGNWANLQMAANYIDPSIQTVERFQSQISTL